MPSLDKLKRFREDLLLLQTIKRVGVQNYSLLSRLTGMNVETVRYKVNKHLARLGLETMVEVNYAEMGLALFYIMVKPDGSSGKSWQDRLEYLVFAGKVLGSNRYFCFAAVPYRLKRKYAESLSRLKEDGLIEEYEMGEVRWSRYPPFRQELYDFETKSWNVDWERVEMPMPAIGPSFVYAGGGVRR